MVGISDPKFSVKPAGPASKKPDTEIEIVDLVDSESEDSLYTSWLKGRYTHIREVVHLD